MNTKPESKHTPTPWRTVEISVDKKNPFRFAITNGVTRLVQYIDKQTAEHIVRAVNSHDTLMDAVRLAYKLAKADYDNAIETRASKIVTDGAFIAMDTFRKAIAQAEGK